MAGGTRIVLIAVALAPLPLATAFAWSNEAGAASGLPTQVVSARDGGGLHRLTRREQVVATPA